jgi:hypothetical protein
MLQRHGFTVPDCSDFDKFRARIEYNEYRRQYINSDLTPDYLNDDALNIYVFLLELFKDTRYELKRIPLIGFFFILYPYVFVTHLAIFLYYLYIGLIYCFCIIFFPVLIFYVSYEICYEFYKVLEFWHLIFFMDLHYFERLKTKIWDNIRRNADREQKKLAAKKYRRSRFKDFIQQLKKFF